MLLDPFADPVSGDAGRLQQVLWNLLSNAVKFTPEGGWVKIKLERVNSHVEITVSDSGQGIKEEFLPFVFDRFRQADGTITRKQGGLGLGLSIVKQLVDLHDGSIQADSPGENHGSIFVVQLPRIATHQESKDNLQQQSKASGELTEFDCSPQFDGLHVLVVDDEADARELIRAVLKECGSEVTTATSAVEALEMFEKIKPDVLISDIGMPEMDGYTFINKIRALETDSKVKTPAIALTAYAKAEDRERALLEGYHIHLPKPIEPMKLVAIIASLTEDTANLAIK
jgi:CheY-like chemotaxis protein/anti-sigma regulatory factor (Ser/Thr protein kinase)